jgi:signal-transduction protein with cAMP-binding, CBS, and nucleotidyltransferase domain
MTDGDTLDWLHARAKRRDGRVPELDVETTLSRVRDHGAPGAYRVNFWQALSPTEQAAFASAARERTFPAGAALMREGEPANDVFVIVDGWTKVCHGEVVIVERGPGRLIGEGGTAPGRVRSATVIALETVRALVISTADFAAFAGEHPNVPDIVDKEVYDRTTERPGSPG